MPKIAYVEKRFNAEARGIVDQANAILDEYEAQGFDLTLRQLYYQFVSKDLIPNTMRSYKRLGSIVNDARLAGLVDWNRIVDRTRGTLQNSHWKTPGDIIESASYSYKRDLWEGQDWHVEVWIEKEALAGVIDGVCRRLDVPYLSCRGYTSQSEMWLSAQRLGRKFREGRKLCVVHLGDHDPSGVDMTRDITDRLRLFLSHDVRGRIRVDRIALNMDQVRQYNCPPNPAKVTDSRATAYIEEHGRESWELDALEPRVIVKLIEEKVQALCDQAKFGTKKLFQEEERKELKAAAERWPEVSELLKGRKDEEE